MPTRTLIVYASLIIRVSNTLLYVYIDPFQAACGTFYLIHTYINSCSCVTVCFLYISILALAKHASFSINRSLLSSRLRLDDAIRDHIDPSRCSLLIVPIMPYTNRNLTNMASAKQEHQETRDTQAPTIRKRQCSSSARTAFG
jgi:hypothetical protein